ncbi:NAD(P)-dependent oxidoreductase [Pseudonocardia sp.]|jgi:3-hydroxyisobutyrate dehydrogenase|uniref:NAD(P)-dependent oxidoreductase n=1 Tax=Pseudonocardia sp. TaxID=60912 RepID=UPI002616ADF8|nr:NAD(P)-dependent oxidoreductase [Pseudonocardia sp.]MCW2717665.1 beta-hydroxyacid dehydrogenase, 3-hydroxyisobutyrate dehydrogenase [Pseudonocardia sp.]MDT7612664.1 3-hydroxyisobutyrate dehydrogenase [Pseudonocardiales bacterium]
MTADARTVAGRRVAVLGTGTMGAPIARNLLRAGMHVRVWNRTPAKAEGLLAEGALLASSPAAAAADADVLITMLTDGDAVEQVMTGPDGALSALPPDAIWVQMSTVGVEWADRLADLAARHRVAFVDAPVSGSSQPAENGQLVVLAAGARSARSRLEPVFEVLGRQILWLEHVGDGSRLKLALNNWLSVLVEGMAETLTLSSALGLNPHLFVATIAGGPLASPYATAKATAMMDADFAPGFPLQHAAKDATLAAEAAHHSGVELPLTAALLDRWQRAIASGHGHDDVASAITVSPAPPTVSATAEPTPGSAPGEGLVRAEPSRERRRGQLMVAPCRDRAG